MPEVPSRVGRLRAAGSKRDELVAHVDEGHAAPSAAPQLELEYPPIPRECLLEVPDLEGHMVDAHQTRHRSLDRSARARRGWRGGTRRNRRALLGRPAPGGPAAGRDRRGLAWT